MTTRKPNHDRQMGKRSDIPKKRGMVVGKVQGSIRILAVRGEQKGEVGGEKCWEQTFFWGIRRTETRQGRVNSFTFKSWSERAAQ